MSVEPWWNYDQSKPECRGPSGLGHDARLLVLTPIPEGALGLYFYPLFIDVETEVQAGKDNVPDVTELK